CAVISHLAAGASNMSSMLRAIVQGPQEVTTGLGTPPKTGWAKLGPELLATDIGPSIEFRSDRPGFATAYQRPKEKFTYLARPEGSQLMLSQRSGSRGLDRPRTPG